MSKVLSEERVKLVHDNNLHTTLSKSIKYFTDIIGKYDQLIESTEAGLNSNKVKADYERTIHSLEVFIKNLSHEILKKNQEHSKISIHAKNLKSIDSLGKKNENISLTNSNNKSKSNSANSKRQMKKSMESNPVIESILDNAQRLANDRLNREKMALQKVQEALNLAENAILEKEEALNREKVIREECNQLARTVAQVMEEAAQKVEHHFDEIRKQHREEVKRIDASRNELKKQLVEQKEKTLALEREKRALQQKLKDMMAENSVLDSDLQLASQAIVGMELKLQTIENLIDQDSKTNKIGDEVQQEINDFLMNNKQLKEKWKFTMEDVTLRLRFEIRNLQKENASLRAQVQDFQTRNK